MRGDVKEVKQLLQCECWALLQQYARPAYFKFYYYLLFSTFENWHCRRRVSFVFSSENVNFIVCRDHSAVSITIKLVSHNITKNNNNMVVKLTRTLPYYTRVI